MRSMVAAGSAGLVDAAASALTTFLLGVLALRVLPEEGIALYSLLMTGFITGMLFPQQLSFFPVRMRTNLSSDKVRPSLLTDVWRARRTVSFAALVVVGFGLPMIAEIEFRSHVLITASAVAATAAGAVQMHARSSLHILGHHKLAALSSIMSASVVASTIFLIEGIEVPVWLTFGIPFGATALAYLVSLVPWIFIIGKYAAIGEVGSEPLKSRVFFIAPDLIVQATWYTMTLLVLVLLGPLALVELEAARIASAPVFIVASGVASFTIPSIVRIIKGTKNKRSAMNKLGIVQMIIMLGAGAYGCALALGGSLLTPLFGRPVDYGLAITRTLAAGMEGTSNTLTSIYVASGKAVAGVLVVFASALVALILSVPLLLTMGVHGMPISQAIASALRTIGGTAYIRKYD